MTNEKKNSRKLIVIISIVAILVIALGVTYAFYTYSRNGTYNNKLIAGDIYMRYKEGSAINLSGAMPSSTYPSSTTGNYYEFQIIGKNTNTTKDITYNVKLAHGDPETGKTRIPDQHLVFKLVEVVNNEEQTPALVEDQSYQTIPGTTIYTATIAKNTTNERTRTFRLYARISENVGIGTNATFTIDEWNDLYASIKINVDGGFVEGGNTPNLTGAQHIVSNYEQDNNPETNGGIVGINQNGELYNPNANPSSTTTNNALTNNLVNKTNETKASRTDANDTVIREYRYSGNSAPVVGETSPEENTSTMKNYIWFNGERWRIVGIFDKTDDTFGNGNDEYVMKIVRNDPLSNVPSTYTNINNEEFRLAYYENESFSCVYWNFDSEERYDNDWTNAGLMYYLNEETTGRESENQSFYDKIDDTYKTLIDTTTYYLGNVNYNQTPQGFYADERNISSSNIWSGKIGLLYPSDYAYSYPTSYWESNYDTDNWLNRKNAYEWREEWFLSPSAGSGEDVMYWFSGGIDKFYVTYYYAVRPVLNLKSDTTIISGDGSYTNPYRIVAEN